MITKKQIKELESQVWHEKEKAIADLMQEMGLMSSYDPKLEFDKGSIAGMNALFSILGIKIDKLFRKSDRDNK